jgi:hypothetical protein
LAVFKYFIDNSDGNNNSNGNDNIGNRIDDDDDK